MNLILLEQNLGFIILINNILINLEKISII
jgi:hypothetical protein